MLLDFGNILTSWGIFLEVKKLFKNLEGLYSSWEKS